jgi:Ca2+-binding EF-hand superfamily protein
MFAKVMAEYDSNKDGELSIKEANSLSELVSPFDEDQSGAIDAEEFSLYIKKTGTKAVPPPANGPAVAIQPQEVINDWSKKQIAKYDRNRDGKLTKDEWGQMISKPDGADVNKDGEITAEEYTEFRKRRP